MQTDEANKISKIFRMHKENCAQMRIVPFVVRIGRQRMKNAKNIFIFFVVVIHGPNNVTEHKQMLEQMYCE